MSVAWYRTACVVVAGLMSGCLYGCGDSSNSSFSYAGGMARKIDRSTIEDKVRGSWVGQMAGVAWGAPTEFLYAGRTIPEARVPIWKPEMINLAFLQDDVYVEIPLLMAMRTA